MKFIKGVQEFEFEDNQQYPSSRPIEKVQVMDRSAGGVVHTESFARDLNRFNLGFESMNKHDYEGLLNWYINVVDGMMDDFIYEDEYGVQRDVRFIMATIDFPETSYQRYSGSVILEEIYEN